MCSSWTRPTGVANRRIGHLHRVDADGGEARRLTTHPPAVTEITWAADSQLVFFVAADPRSAAVRERARAGDDVYAFEETDFEQTHLGVVDLTGKTTQITITTTRSSSCRLAAGAARALLPEAPFQVGDAHWSADGTRIDFIANRGVHTQPMQVEPAGGSARAPARTSSR